MRLAPIAVAIVVAGVRSGSAQAPEPQKPELSIPVSTEVVRIDVIVTDKGGKARPGLKREDFQVLEDGQPQSLTQFEAFVAPAPRRLRLRQRPRRPRHRPRRRPCPRRRPAATWCWRWTTSTSKPRT